LSLSGPRTANGCRLNFTTDGPRVYRRIGNFLLNVHRPGRSRSQGGAGPGEVGMARPALVVVSGNPGTLTALEQELRRRYGADYQVLAVAAPAAALAALEQLSEASDQVALLMADQCLRGMAGVEFLSQAHQLHPAAKRVLLITYGDVAAWVSGLQAMALGQLDYWLNAPWGPPELQLYPAVSELLGQWARATASAGLPPELVRVIGPRWSARSHELRDLLGRTTSHMGSTTSRRRTGGGCWRRPGWRLPPSRCWSCRTGRCWQTRPTSSSPERWESRPGQPPAATTSPWSAPDQLAWPQPPTPPRRGSEPCCWSVGRPDGS